MTLVFSCRWFITELTLGLPADHNHASCESSAGWTDVFSAFSFFFFFFTSLKCYSFQTLSALSHRAIWCISQPEENRCAKIMHQYFLTNRWLNTANRCTSSARVIILSLLILSVCFSLFSLPWFCVWCLVTVLLPRCSVDHLRSGCSPHTDSHSHGGKAAAAHHSQVSERTVKVCTVNQASNVRAVLCGMVLMFKKRRDQDDIHLFQVPKCWILEMYKLELRSATSWSAFLPATVSFLMLPQEVAKARIFQI